MSCSKCWWKSQVFRGKVNAFTILAPIREGFWRTTCKGCHDEIPGYNFIMWVIWWNNDFIPCRSKSLHKCGTEGGSGTLWPGMEREGQYISMLIYAWTKIHLCLNFCLNMLTNVCSPQWQVVMLLLCMESFLCSCFVISSNCNKRCLS